MPLVLLGLRAVGRHQRQHPDAALALRYGHHRRHRGGDAGADPVTTALETAPLVLLFLASIVMLKYVDRRDAKRAAEELTRDRPERRQPLTTRPEQCCSIFAAAAAAAPSRSSTWAWPSCFGVGLVLFGVGTGSGGGLLNAFTGSGSSNAQSSAISQQEKTAAGRPRPSPTDPAAWAAPDQRPLVERQRPGQQTDHAGVEFTRQGQAGAEPARPRPGTRYAALTKQPDPDLATPRRPRLRRLGEYATPPTPGRPRPRRARSRRKGYACLAAHRLCCQADAQGRSRQGQSPVAGRQDRAQAAQLRARRGQDHTRRSPSPAERRPSAVVKSRPRRAVSSAGRAGDS